MQELRNNTINITKPLLERFLNKEISSRMTSAKEVLNQRLKDWQPENFQKPANVGVDDDTFIHNFRMNIGDRITLNAADNEMFDDNILTVAEIKEAYKHHL